MDYFEQIMPEMPVICGLALKPLSIGRYRRMRREKICFVADEPATATAGDLLKAVLICSMTCADYESFLAQPDFKKQLQSWASKAGFLPPRYVRWPIIGGWIVKLVGAEVAQERAEREAVHLLEQMRLFQAYIVAGSRAPAYWDETTDARSSAAHWSHSIESVLREKQGWTKQEVDEEPLTKALWDYFKSMESAGLVRLMTEAEQVELETPLTPEQAEESRVALEKLWRHKFGDAPMPTE